MSRSTFAWLLACGVIFSPGISAASDNEATMEELLNMIASDDCPEVDMYERMHQHKKAKKAKDACDEMFGLLKDLEYWQQDPCNDAESPACRPVSEGSFFSSKTVHRCTVRIPQDSWSGGKFSTKSLYSCFKSAVKKVTRTKSRTVTPQRSLSWEKEKPQRSSSWQQEKPQPKPQKSRKPQLSPHDSLPRVNPQLEAWGYPKPQTYSQPQLEWPKPQTSQPQLEYWSKPQTPQPQLEYWSKPQTPQPQLEYWPQPKSTYSPRPQPSPQAQSRPIAQSRPQPKSVESWPAKPQLPSRSGEKPPPSSPVRGSPPRSRTKNQRSRLSFKETSGSRETDIANLKDMLNKNGIESLLS